MLPVMVITGGPDGNANPALNVSSEVVLTQVEGDEVADLNGRTNGETAAQLMRKQTREAAEARIFWASGISPTSCAARRRHRTS